MDSEDSALRLRINPATKEPFLRLSSPHENIIITPPRVGDDEHLFTLFSDLRIAAWLYPIPVPFTRAHARAMLREAKDEADALLNEIRSLDTEHMDNYPKFVGGCPVKCVREVRKDGTDVFIGYITVHRGVFADVQGEIECQIVVEENNKKTVGDPSIRWSFRNVLLPSYHGQGIMTAVVSQIVHAWIVPRMNGRYIAVFTISGNIGSDRVLEKNGFVRMAVLEIAIRGEKRKVNHMEWRLQVA
ncbi:hypothetical protein EV401DRAFT_1851464 [Pisolithus croceorrhizus]|nr:hypothetical protein EV401DRAFT_1851464 [Pisolithus croceorrhizus]